MVRVRIVERADLQLLTYVLVDENQRPSIRLQAHRNRYIHSV